MMTNRGEYYEYHTTINIDKLFERCLEALRKVSEVDVDLIKDLETLVDDRHRYDNAI